MRHSLQAIFASGFFVRTGSAEEIIVIADSADFSHEALHNRRRVGSQLRAALRRHAGDTVFMDALRRKVVAWGLEQPAAAYRKSEGLIEVVVAAVARGRLMAKILPVGVSHNEFATTSARSIPSKTIERDLRIRSWQLGQSSFLRRVVSAAASVTLVGQIAQTIQAYEMIKSTTEISRMDPIEKIGIVLEGTLPKLPVPIAKEFAAFLLTIGVTRLAVILAGWAASHFVGVGEVIDIFLGAAFAIGCLLTGWALADGVGTMIDATNDAVDAQNQRDLDAASTKMAKGIETLGVALISLALVRGIKTGAGGKVSGKSESSGLTEQRAIGSDRRVRLQARWEAVQQKARAERTPEAAGRGSLSGEPTEIPPGSDAETSRSLARENESANSLAKNGYSVEQNPKVPGLKRPDYKIDGEIFDCYSPSTDKVRNIASSIDDKVQSGQAQNVVVNLKDSSVTSEMLNTQISNYPIDGLKRLIIIDKDGVVAESLLRGN